MSTQGIDQLLSQLRVASAAAAGGAVAPAQQEADKLSKSFEQGAPGVELQDVMISLQKANISFQTMVQVRNKLVTAYQEIMNMQV
jgi:flagellar hook-basal body complex protein FliE